jgi:hypothetical protein
LCWADYDATADVVASVPSSSFAFDDQWLPRFVVAAHERGYHLFSEDNPHTANELRRMIRDYEDKYYGAGAYPAVEELWLAASASIVLRELEPSGQARKVFPFGMGLTYLLWSPVQN